MSPYANTDALTLADATAGELPIIAAALAQAELPSIDLAAPNGRFYCFRDRSGALIGFSGLEVQGANALLRSVLVLPQQRRRGFGRAIVALTLDRARVLDVRQVFLLTMTAQAFFAGLGFTLSARSEAPERIAASGEFTDLCPATAICMTKTIAVQSQG